MLWIPNTASCDCIVFLKTGEEQAGRSDVRDQADPPQLRGQDAQQEDHAGGEAPLQAQP